MENKGENERIIGEIEDRKRRKDNRFNEKDNNNNSIDLDNNTIDVGRENK